MIASLPKLNETPPAFNIILSHRSQLCKNIVMEIYINAETVLRWTMKNTVISQPSKTSWGQN